MRPAAWIRQASDRFLASVEKRAFHMAQITTGSPDHAMDIVQDAMLSLVTITVIKVDLTRALNAPRP
jgi:hypothetical protein